MRIFAILFFTFNSILFNNNLEDGFVYLKDIDHSVIVDLKYYSSENFTGQLVEGYHSNTAILTNEAALALSNAQDDFNKLGYSLILYDAYVAPAYFRSPFESKNLHISLIFPF